MDNKNTIIKSLVIDIIKHINNNDDFHKHKKYFYKLSIMMYLFNIIYKKNEYDIHHEYYKEYFSTFRYDDYLIFFLSYHIFDLNHEQYLSFFDMFSDSIFSIDISDKMKDDVITIINKHKFKYLSN